MSVNSICILGNLTRDMECRKEGAVYVFDLAFTQRRKVNGDWKDVPGFIPCTVYGKRGQSLLAYLKKGTKVAVFGTLEYHDWKAKDGTKRHDVTINVQDIDFMSRRPKGQLEIPMVDDMDVPFD